MRTGKIEKPQSIVVYYTNLRERKTRDMKLLLSTGKVVLNLKHERAVEDVIVFPSGSLLAVASGPEVFIWDIVGGGRLLNRISNFQKTVLCLEYATAAGSSVAINAQPRLLAGSLDCHVKMYDIENFQVISSCRQLRLFLKSKKSCYQ